ncbi:MAG TPA: tRNA(His) guanylyltransferase Thg1 family protein [Methanobacterium sp.]|nr:tRNA(His) guanylyltransferase Thg1 family protein [Methanobacterium sp.]
MKDCELYSNLKTPCGSRIVVRVDGRNFSSLAKHLELEKPYDREFVEMLVAAGMDLVKEFAPIFIYTFSDEVSILLDYVPFSGRVEKLDSVFASFLAGSFTRHLLSTEKFSDMEKFKPISFDSRVIPLNDQGVVAYFIGRQDEAWRNCLNGYSYWTLRKKHDKEEAVQLLNGKKKQDLHELLHQNHINIRKVPSWQKRGVAIRREYVEVEGYNPLSKENVISHRFKPCVEWDLPIFNKEYFYSNEILKKK